jgi:hypothetical protein
MQIFDQEKLDGLEPLITSSASILCAGIAEPSNSINTKNVSKYMKSIASIDDKDLYYVQSILVSSSWNKNDDIFDKNEVWVAKNTPEDKPTNLEHDESVIIGHITANWPITEDGILIDQDTPMENLPEKYHILTGSVIYRGFSNPALRDRAEKLISEIQNGIKYVSMECFFKGFDYGILDNTTGSYKILARNNETAYLTKYLRAYGGMGQHENYKLGRVLRNITFTGKGFVDKPANIDSIIFTKNLITDENISISSEKTLEKNEKISISGVSISQSNIKSENITMSSENQVVESQIETVEVKTDNVNDTSNMESMVAELHKEIAELKSAKEQLEITVAELSKSQAESDLVKEEAAKKMKEDEMAKDEENKNLKAALEAANETIAGYKMKEEEMMKKEKKMKRAASLMEIGVEAEVAASTVEKFESLDDEAFDAMTNLFAGKMPPWLEKIKKGDKTAKDTKEEDKNKASEETTDPSVLENVEVEEEVNLGIGGEVETEIDSTRAALENFVRSRLGKKHN